MRKTLFFLFLFFWLTLLAVGEEIHSLPGFPQIKWRVENAVNDGKVTSIRWSFRSTDKKSYVVRLNTFYAGPNTVKASYSNDEVKVGPYMWSDNFTFVQEVSGKADAKASNPTFSVTLDK